MHELSAVSNATNVDSGAGMCTCIILKSDVREARARQTSAQSCIRAQTHVEE